MSQQKDIERDGDLLMADEGTVDTPDSARIAKLPAVRKLTAAGPRRAGAGAALAIAYE
jgi:hypothetical protein